MTGQTQKETISFKDIENGTWGKKKDPEPRKEMSPTARKAYEECVTLRKELWRLADWYYEFMQNNLPGEPMSGYVLDVRRCKGEEQEEEKAIRQRGWLAEIKFNIGQICVYALWDKHEADKPKNLPYSHSFTHHPYWSEESMNKRQAEEQSLRRFIQDPLGTGRCLS